MLIAHAGALTGYLDQIKVIVAAQIASVLSEHKLEVRCNVRELVAEQLEMQSN